MPLTIPDHVLNAAHLTERAAQVEIACRFFESGRLSLWKAAEWVGMTRSEFESALLERGIPLYSPTAEDVRSDLGTLEQLWAAE